MNRKIRELAHRYRVLVIMGIYMVVYLAAFFFLEQRKTQYHIIRSGLDSYIPFCEVFIIPYVLWFFYVSLTVIYLCVKKSEEAGKFAAFLIIGMTAFIVISAIYPNGHRLRPQSFERDNIFTYMVSLLYQTDTSTNILPSIHVYNSIAVMIAVARAKEFRKHKLVSIAMQVLGVLIILSTVFLKQHSVVDVMLALILAAVVQLVVYRRTNEQEDSVRSKKDTILEMLRW